MWPPDASADARCLALVLVGLVLANVALRVAYVARAPFPARAGGSSRPLRAMVVLGSGGHTAEMFALLRAVDHRRYAPRTYVLAATDVTSAAKIHAHEARVGSALAARADVSDAELERATDHDVASLPRSREVGQNYAHSAVTTLRAILHALALVRRERPDVVLCNGPGTCVPVAIAAFAARCACGLRAGPAVVYVESVARTTTISLSGWIVYALGLADAVFVQWEGLLKKYPRAKYAGRVV